MPFGPPYLLKGCDIIELMQFFQAHQATSSSSDSLALRGLLVGLVVALLLVFIVPTFDHHYAERQHDHSHLFLTASASSQGHPDLHPFEQTHSHTGFGEQESKGDGVIYQTSNDLFGESGSVSFTAFISDGLTRTTDNHEMLSFAILARGSILSENSPDPPTRPPLT